MASVGGLLTLAVAAALLWNEGRSAAWTALGTAALFGRQIGREAVVQKRGGPRPTQQGRDTDLILVVGLDFLLIAILQ